MCLGEGARNANKAATRQYQYQLAQRERNWMNTLALTSVQRVQYDQGIDSSNVALQNFYGEMQEKYGDLIGQSMQEGEQGWKDFLKTDEGGKMAAKGQTGRSAGRISVTELGDYLSKGSRRAYQLTQAQEKMSDAGAKMAAQTRAQQMQLFAQNNIIRNPELAPPRPVMQNVGMAAFKDALSIASSIAGIASGFGSLGGNKMTVDEFIKAQAAGGTK